MFLHSLTEIKSSSIQENSFFFCYSHRFVCEYYSNVPAWCEHKQTILICAWTLNIQVVSFKAVNIALELLSLLFKQHHNKTTTPIHISFAFQKIKLPKSNWKREHLWAAHMPTANSKQRHTKKMENESHERVIKYNENVLKWDLSK